MPLRYADLREFLQYLEGRDQLRRIDVSVSPVLEMTEISDRVLRQGGPALLFRNPEAEGRRWHSPTSSAPRSGWPWAWARIPWPPCVKWAAFWPT